MHEPRPLPVLIRYKSRPILNGAARSRSLRHPPRERCSGQVLYAGVLLRELGLPVIYHISSQGNLPTSHTAALCDRSDLEQPIAVDLRDPLNEMAR